MLITITISLNTQIDKFVYHSDLQTTNLAYFPSKCLNYRAINLFLRKISTLTIAKFTISTRTDITLVTSLKKLRANTMCSAFNPDCGYDNSASIVIGDVYCPNAKCSGRLCLHKKTFQSLVRSDYQCPHCESVCQVRNVPFEGQRNSFFLSLVQRVYIFEENSKSVQDVIGDVYCPGKYCINREKCESIGGYATTQRSIYGCGTCGAWLFVHKAPFTLQEHVKTTKTDKLAFSLPRRMKLLPEEHLLLNVPFQSTKRRKKQLCVDNKIQETIGNVDCPTCINEKCVYSSTNKTTSFYDCKKCKTCCHILNIPFNDQKPTIMLFGGDGRHCFVRKTSRYYEKEKPSPILKKFLRQSQPSTSELDPKKDKSSPKME